MSDLRENLVNKVLNAISSLSSIPNLCTSVKYSPTEENVDKIINIVKRIEEDIEQLKQDIVEIAMNSLAEVASEQEYEVKITKGGFLLKGKVNE